MDPIILGIAVVNGIVVGGLYGAIAVGLSLIFGVMRVINFAHGSFLMIGLFIPFWLWQLYGFNPYLSILVAAPALFGLGYAVQAVLIAPLYKRERAMVIEPLSALMLTAGVGLILDNVTFMFFGPDYRGITLEFASRALWVGDILNINYTRGIAFLASLVIAAGLSLFLAYSDLGRSIRSTAQNRDAAALCGINVMRIYNVTFGLGCAILGVVGCLMIPFYLVSPHIGLAFGVRSFITVVLGGIGSIPGCILGGLILGVVESVAAQFVTASSASIFSFIIFILVLFFKPTGLLGMRV
ncbi:MAG: branched-chain amino acid ABC transporter permease [Zetaproteobacteria bacterium]|jgi:branched-chain amino acid transport system permease protein|nr:MAG: branched-chain amino acid ABC transporter permease [Zetaproteobacteria bacterium]